MKNKTNKKRTTRKHSAATKRKISASLRGDKNPMWGRRHTNEARRKISEANRGENSAQWGKPNPKLSEINRQKVGDRNPQWGCTGYKSPSGKETICTSPLGKKYRYGSAHEASRELEKKYGIMFHHTAISSVANGRYPYPTYKGWKFEYSCVHEN